MALQLGALRDASRAANVPDELAARAAEEVAGYDNRLAGIERRMVELSAEIERLRAEMDRRFTELRAEMEQRFTRVNTLLTVLIALVIGVFVKQFFH